MYDNNNKVISKTVENTDGSVVQSFYNAEGVAYAKIEKDSSGNLSCTLGENSTNAQSTQQSEETKGQTLQPESNSRLDNKTKFDLGKSNDESKDSNKDKNDKKDNDDLGVRVKELETLVLDLKRTISGLGNNTGTTFSLSGMALDALKAELKKRGIKTIDG